MIHPDDEAFRDAIQEGRERLAEKGPLVIDPSMSCSEIFEKVNTFLEQLPLPGAAFTPPEWMEDE